jgi:hypothetical protein
VTDFVGAMAEAAARYAAPVFRRNGWTWLDNTEPPTEEEIRESVREKIQHVLDDPSIRYTRSGRFQVARHGDEGMPDEITVSLELGWACPELEQMDIA